MEYMHPKGVSIIFHPKLVCSEPNRILAGEMPTWKFLFSGKITQILPKAASKVHVQQVGRIFKSR